MDLKTLRERGGIIPAAPVKREVTWTHAAEDGGEVTDTFTVHIVRHSFGTIDRMFTGGVEADKSQAARFISGSVLLGDDASEAIPYEVAYQLEPALARLLMEAINEVNGLAVASAKN
jgi:hypothetical protein